MIKTPLSLYVHMPWCVKKCPYCDFNSHTAGNRAATDRYTNALLTDLENEAARNDGRPIETIFIGGGTPSLFPPGEIRRLLEAIRSRLEVAVDAEITMEANPGTVECGAPAGYREAGVNRLSIGAQSFNDDMLTILGRIHRSDDIRHAVEEARSGGFDNINLDVMHALPGQDSDGALADLEAAVSLEPEHLSWYQLTLEPNTVFHARPPAGIPDGDEAWEIQLAGQDFLARSGFDQYEVSAYARDGRRCRHNLNYWLFGDYLAIGAGSHGKYSAGDEIRRFRKPANPEQYMQAMESGADLDPGEPVASHDRVFEFMLNALRTTDGFEEALFAERSGLPLEMLEKSTNKSREKGLIERSAAGRWRPTGLGRRFLDDLVADFLYAQERA